MNDSTSGTINTSLGGATIASPGPPHTYLGVARSMLPGALLLAQSPNTSPMALALVSSHVVECSLKAYLSRDGSDSILRKPQIRHNLVGLCELARNEGLPIDSSPPNWVSRLGEVHGSPYFLRYSTGVNGIVLPNAESIANGARNLLTLVEKSI